MNESRVLLGKKIKYYRELIRMSQEELAQKAGYKSKSSIAKIENGLARVPAYKLIEIATALGVSVTEFLTSPLSEEVPVVKVVNEVVNEYVDNSQERLRKVISIIISLDDNQLEKAESILTTVFEVNNGNTNLQ